MSFGCQLLSLIKRNLILKYRNKLQTVPEILLPLFILLTLIIFNLFFKNELLQAQTFEAELISDHNLSSAFQSSTYLYITPNNTNTHHIQNVLIQDFKRVKIFDNMTILKDTYLKENENKRDYKSFYALEFNKFPNNYTIHIEWNAKLFSSNKVNLFDDSDFEICRKKNKDYKHCAGNEFVYDGLSYFITYIDKSIRRVNSLIFFVVFSKRL